MTASEDEGRVRARILARLTAPEHSLGVWIGLWVVVAAAQFGALVPVLFDRTGPVNSGDIFSFVGGSFAACGLIAWRRRPDSLSGPLMIATGMFSLLNSLLGQLDSPLALTVGDLLADVWVIFFVALLLTFTTRGRLRTTLDRRLVGVFALPVVLQLFYMQFEPAEGNLLFVTEHAGIADAIDTAQRLVLCVGCVAVGVVLALRWRAASAPRRRAMLPSMFGAFSLLLLAALLANDLVAGSRSQVLLWVAALSLVTVPAAFLFGLLRSRLARSGLADLLRDLTTMHGAALQTALGRAVGDPGLVLAVRVPGRSDYTGPDGAPVPLPPAAGRAVVHVDRDGAEVAAIVYDASLDDDPDLVEAIRAAAGIALQNEHLQRESSERLAELHASRERLVAAGDAERRRLERNLHDGAQQRLVALALQLRMIERRIDSDPATTRLVNTASDELAHSLSELRELAQGIHPAVLDHGLAAALDSLASRATVPTAVSTDLPDGLPAPVELAAYFVASEALANIGKYAAATTATISVRRAPGSVVLAIADNGVGGADAGAGSGLSGLRDRVEALHGHLHVHSPPGAGTVITAEIPYEPS